MHLQFSFPTPRITSQPLPQLQARKAKSRSTFQKASHAHLFLLRGVWRRWIDRWWEYIRYQEGQKYEYPSTRRIARMLFDAGIYGLRWSCCHRTHMFILPQIRQQSHVWKNTCNFPWCLVFFSMFPCVDCQGRRGGVLYWLDLVFVQFLTSNVV